MLSRLSHSHIVKLYDTCQASDRCAIVMEYVDGGTLKQQIISAGDRYLEEGLILYWIAQITAALHYIHSM